LNPAQPGRRCRLQNQPGCEHDQPEDGEEYEHPEHLEEPDGREVKCADAECERDGSSGNVLMASGDRYLCIVAARQRTASVRLPFDDDLMLPMILSKAYLLADDDKITDVSILRQMGR
jgi:hypothetical protein